MGESQNKQWMISPKSLIKLLGAEYDIMQRAGTGVIIKFYTAALTIVVIFFLTLGSIYHAIDLLFHDLATETLLSGFFSLLFACIYIFLINTFSKEQLPGNESFFSGSNIIRTSFIVFIAYLVAQPLTIIAAGEKLEQETAQYKQTVLDRHLNVIHGFYAAELQKLHDRKEYCIAQEEQFGTDNFDAELAGINQNISSIDTKIKLMENEANRKINGSSFFLYQIKMGNHYGRAWILTILFVLLFLLPGYLVYSISSDNAYYRLKKDYEKNMVERAYLDFTIQYKEIFQDNQGVTVNIFSRFEDPPFKRVRKTAAIQGSMEDFLKKYITAAE